MIFAALKLRWWTILWYYDTGSYDENSYDLSPATHGFQTSGLITVDYHVRVKH